MAASKADHKLVLCLGCPVGPDIAHVLHKMVVVGISFIGRKEFVLFVHHFFFDSENLRKIPTVVTKRSKMVIRCFKELKLWCAIPN